MKTLSSFACTGWECVERSWSARALPRPSFLMTLADLAQLTNATLPPEAATDRRISGAAALDDAGPEEVAFFVHPKYLGALRRTKAAAAFVPLDFAGESSTVLLRVVDPSMSFALAIKHLTPAQEAYAP